MNSRSTGFARAVLFAASALAVSSCGGGGGAGGPFPGEEEGILKISYFRGLPDSKTKRMEPTFRVIMSLSWQDRVGESPREPLAKAAAGRIYVGFLPDSEVAVAFRKLHEFGIEKLKARDPKEFDPQEYGRRAINTAIGHPGPPPATESSLTRIFTIGTDKWSKSYYFKDHALAPDAIEQTKIFAKCELVVLRICENSVSWRTLSDPLPGKDR